jgi:hypothetical protein
MGSSHHGDENAFIAEQMHELKEAFRNKESDFLQKRFAEQVEGIAKPLFPEGKIKNDDEGALAFRIATDPEKKIVVIDFGKQVTWLGLPKAEALGLANLLKEHAETL